MSVRLDHKMTAHPKIIAAAATLGGQTALARVIALVVDGLCYSDAFLTDGYIPRGVVAQSKVTPQPLVVAHALTTAKLWHRVNGGFRIHDYGDYNKSADEVKETQRKWREKKRRQRRNQQGEFSLVSPDLSPVESHRTRARGTGTGEQRTDRTSTNKPRTNDPGSSTDSGTTARSARGIHTFPTKKPTHRILCAMFNAELAVE